MLFKGILIRSIGIMHSRLSIVSFPDYIMKKKNMKEILMNHGMHTYAPTLQNCAELAFFVLLRCGAGGSGVDGQITHGFKTK